MNYKSTKKHRNIKERKPFNIQLKLQKKKNNIYLCI